jgi:putative sterol carrier protein
MMKNDSLSLFIEGLRSMIDIKLEDITTRDFVEGWDRTIILKIRKVGSVFLVFKEGKAEVFEKTSRVEDADIVLEGDWNAFIKIAQGRMNPLMAYLRRKVKRKKGSIRDVLKLVKILKVPKGRV